MILAIETLAATAERLAVTDVVLLLAVGGLAGERVIAAVRRLIRGDQSPAQLVRSELSSGGNGSMVSRVRRIEERVVGLERGQRDILRHLLDRKDNPKGTQ